MEKGPRNTRINSNASTNKNHAFLNIKCILSKSWHLLEVVRWIFIGMKIMERLQFHCYYVINRNSTPLRDRNSPKLLISDL